MILMLTAILYYPALDSRFLLDDFSSLDSLSDIDVTGYTHFILGGSAGPSGRPVSLLTFALQHESWPGNPFALKLVNLIIHLMTGVLVYILGLSLFSYLELSRKYHVSCALLATLLWLIQPVQISSVLYTVQRMTLLSAFFTLGGILAYLKLWGRTDIPPRTSDYIKWTMVYVACLMLAIFSKENGVLLPIQILVIEFVLLQGITRPRPWIIWTRIFLLLPLFAVFVYLALRFDNVMAAYQARSYGMLERLLTESRILFDYLYNITFPRPSAFGLYHDDYTVSRGLFSPPATFFSVAGILLLFVSALIARKRVPAVSFAVLWFFSSHLLESTYINLELYFEHRNYLAVYGVCFLLTYLALKIHEHLQKKIITCFFVAVLITAPALVTLLELHLWSRPIEQALEWQRRSPGSMRAHEDIGNLYIVFNDAERALKVFQNMRALFPDDIYPYMKVINIKSCLQKSEVTDEDWRTVLDKAQHAKWYGLSPVAELNALIDNLQKGKCAPMNIYLLIRLILVLAYNPDYAHHRDMFHELAAILNMNLGETEAALNNIDEALLQKKTVSRYFLKVRILLDQQRTAEASQVLEEIRQLFRLHPAMQLAYRKPLAVLERRLTQVSGNATHEQ